MVDMNFEQARHNMIAQQIRPWEVLDERVLNLLVQVPREDFVTDAYRALAFTDMEIPIGHGHAMMSPKLEARMLQALDVQPSDTVLEIGTGSGYVTALLGRLARHVYSVDIHPDFIEAAAARLSAQHVDNVTLETGDAAGGWDSHGAMDVIAVTGSLPEPAEALERQLKPGGRMFVIVGDAPAMEALLVTRIGDNEWHREVLFETVIAPLENAPRSDRFIL